MTATPTAAELNARDLAVTLREAHVMLALGRQSARRGVTSAPKVYRGIASSLLWRAVARMGEREGLDTTGWFGVTNA